MSRRKRHPGARPEVVAGRSDATASEPRAPEPRPARPGVARRLAVDLGILVAVFAATVGIAELAGAANLGVAIGVGQVAFAVVLVVLLLRA